MDRWLVPLVIFSALGLFWLVNYFREKSRLKKLTLFAEELDLEMHPTLPEQDARRFGVFPLASQGERRNAGLTFTIDDGNLRIVLFDYETISGSGKSKNHQKYVLGMATDSSIQAPGLYLSPSSWIAVLTDVFAKKRIELEGNPKFSSDYRILGEQPEEVVSFLTPARCSVLQSTPFKSFSAFRNTLLIEHPSKSLQAKEARQFLATTLAVAKAMRN